MPVSATAEERGMFAFRDLKEFESPPTVVSVDAREADSGVCLRKHGKVGKGLESVDTFVYYKYQAKIAQLDDDLLNL